MSFDYKNVSATFQRTLDTLLSKFNWQTCLIYLGTVVVFTQSSDAHLKNVDMVMSTLHKADVSLNLKKCLFITDSAKYLGLIIKPGALTLKEAHIKKLSQLQHPRSITGPRYFIRLCNL